MEQAVEVLGSIRRINKTDAKNLLANYGSINNVILAEDYGEFMNLDGIG
jgi:ERCC4-type nuclease